MRQIARIQDTRDSAVVQDNNVLFVVSILRMKKSFKVYSTGPGLSEKCCLYNYDNSHRVGAIRNGHIVLQW